MSTCPSPASRQTSPRTSTRTANPPGTVSPGAPAECSAPACAIPANPPPQPLPSPEPAAPPVPPAASPETHSPAPASAADCSGTSPRSSAVVAVHQVSLRSPPHPPHVLASRNHSQRRLPEGTPAPLPHLAPPERTEAPAERSRATLVFLKTSLRMSPGRGAPPFPRLLRPGLSDSSRPAYKLEIPDPALSDLPHAQVFNLNIRPHHPSQ